MQLGIYSLEEKKNRIGYYLFHVLIGVILLTSIQTLYISYFIYKSLFVHGMQFLLIALIGYAGGNFLMLRRNLKKRRYMKIGGVITGTTITIGILIGIILRLV